MEIIYIANDYSEIQANHVHFQERWHVTVSRKLLANLCKKSTPPYLCDAQNNLPVSVTTFV